MGTGSELYYSRGTLEGFVTLIVTSTQPALCWDWEMLPHSENHFLQTKPWEIACIKSQQHLSVLTHRPVMYKDGLGLMADCLPLNINTFHPDRHRFVGNKKGSEQLSNLPETLQQ